MKIIDISVRNGTLVVVGMIMTVLWGFLSLRRIPVQISPTIERPIITVETDYPGAAPSEVETEVTRRLEERLAAVEDVREMRSTSSEGRSRITLEFDWGINKDVAMYDVMQKRNLVDNLPEDMEQPQIQAVNPREDESVMRIMVQTDHPEDYVRELLEDRVGPRLEAVAGVGRVRWWGGARREIQVQLDLTALDSRQVTISEVLNALDRENRTARGGKIEQGESSLLVRTVAQFESLEEIEQTVIKSTDQGVIRIRDIAEVVDGIKERERYSRTLGKPAISISVVKKIDANTIEVAEGAKAELARLNEEMNPNGIEFVITEDGSSYIVASIQRVRNNLLIGATLATIVLMLFLRSTVATLAIALTIPVCTVGTFFLLERFGRSVNVISLAGLAFAAGMVVDNAVVVMENIFRHRTELGASPVRAARDAAVEVWGAILASTLTTLAVFIPILFIQEEAGQLFRDIAFSISFAVGLSMIAAITIVPMVASRLLHRIPANYKQAQLEPGARRRSLNPILMFGRGVKAIFQRIADVGIRSRPARAAILMAVAAVFVTSLKLIPPAEYLPQSQNTSIFGSINLPSGMSLEGADRQGRKIEEFILENGPRWGMSRNFFMVSRDRPFFGVFFDRAETSTRQVDAVIRDIEAHGHKSLPSDVRIGVNRGSDFGWRGQSKGLEVVIRGPEADLIGEYSGMIEEDLMAMPEVKNVVSSLNLANPELRVHPDRERLADKGLTVTEVAVAVETLVEGRRASLYRERGKEFDLVVMAREGQILDRERLLAAPIAQDVRLGDVAALIEGLGPVSIEHRAQERAITLDVTIDDAMPLQTFMTKVRRDVIDAYRDRMPAGYHVALSGTADNLDRTMNALGASFVLAVLVIYLLMAALFQSFLYPFIILFTIPLAMTGAFLGIWVTGSDFNVITMLGLVLLAGIVVNNAILLIDFTLRDVRRGIDYHDAVREAVRVRMRPIFMTSATTVLGMSPLAIGAGTGTELYGGLGAAVVGGMVLSTLFTLILIPLVLVTVLELRHWVLTLFGRNPLAEAHFQKQLAELDR